MTQNPKSTNITWHRGKIEAGDREKLLQQQGGVIWLTGLSGSGKSTLAYLLEERLVRFRHLAYVLDGDNVRHGLNRDLGFSAADRHENIRRVGEVAALMADMGALVVTAFISPYREGRAAARQAAGAGRFMEAYLDIPLSECERRDPKGLYRKARAGEIEGFTGIDDPYEVPSAPEVVLPTAELDPLVCVDRLVHYLETEGWFKPR